MNKKQNRRIGTSVDILVYAVLSFIFFIWSLFVCVDTRVRISDSETMIYLLCVLGTIHLVITLFSIKRMQGNWFGLYLIFYCFLFVFSYGQFLMWTFGIHYVSELTVSHHVRFIDNETVVRIQIVSLELLSVFHLGALIAARKYKVDKKNRTYRRTIDWLRILAIPMLVVSAAINFYFSIVGFRQAAVKGYSALFDVYLPPMIKYLSYMFIPALFLNLVLHEYKERWFYWLSGIFLIYAVPLLITGDRGSWVYFLGPWLWCYIKFVDKKGLNPKAEKRKIAISIILVVVIFFVSSAFVSIRGEGYTTAKGNLFSLKDLYTPFVKPVFEMGQSARVLGIVIQDGLDKTYPYGNTVIADILGMVLPRIKVLFGFPDIYVENWISTDYLGLLNYGVGFSTFAEAYLNGGVFFSWLYVLAFGWIMGRLTLIRQRDVMNNPVKTYMALGATTMLGPAVRATMDLWLREFFWGVLLVYLVSKVLSILKRR